MTLVDLLVIAVGLAGALLLDTWVQKRISRSRASLAKAADLDEELAFLHTGLASARCRWEEHLESGQPSLAEDDERTMRRIKRRIARLQR